MVVKDESAFRNAATLLSCSIQCNIQQLYIHRLLYHSTLGARESSEESSRRTMKVVKEVSAFKNACTLLSCPAQH